MAKELGSKKGRRESLGELAAVKGIGNGVRFRGDLLGQFTLCILKLIRALQQNLYDDQEQRA